MTLAEKVEAGLTEALSVATGEAPAARIHVNGHAYVPATTNAATLAALREALDEARERIEHWADVASRADRTRYDTSDDLAQIDAALARIKDLEEKKRDASPDYGTT